MPIKRHQRGRPCPLTGGLVKADAHYRHPIGGPVAEGLPAVPDREELHPGPLELLLSGCGQTVVGESHREVVLAGLDVAVGLGSCLIILDELLGVGGEVPGKLLHKSAPARQHAPPIADHAARVVQSFCAVHLDGQLLDVPLVGALLVLVEEVHEDQAVMPLGERARGVDVGHAVDHADLDLESLHQDVELGVVVVHAEVDDLALVGVLDLAGDDDVMDPARVDPHRAGLV